MSSAISLITAPFSEITVPKAAGPGFPREPPSAVIKNFRTITSEPKYSGTLRSEQPHPPEVLSHALSPPRSS